MPLGMTRACWVAKGRRARFDLGHGAHPGNHQDEGDRPDRLYLAAGPHLALRPEDREGFTTNLVMAPDTAATGLQPPSLSNRRLFKGGGTWAPHG